MKRKIITGSIIALVVIALVAANFLKGSAGLAVFGESGKAFSVKAAKIEKGSISSSISASGSVEEVEKAEVYLDSGLKVDKILAEKNQKVKKGQKIADLNMDSLYSELEQLKIKRNVQELAIKKARLIDGTKSIASLETAIVVAENNLRNAENTLNESKNNHEKNKTLYEASAISQSELERSEKSVSDTQIAFDNAKANYSQALDNLEETKKSNENSRSSSDIDLQTQEQNLKATLLSISDMEKKINRINESVLSPIDGTITDIAIKNGGLTNGAQPAFTVINTDKLVIKANVKEFDIKNVAVGQNVSVTGDAITKEDAVNGKVASIAPSAVKNRTTNGEETVITVTISIEKNTPVLMPGLEVTCNIYTEEKKDVLLSSLDMLGNDKNDEYYVYVVNKDKSTISQQKLKIGIASDMMVEVVEGLNEGDLVVVDPQPTLKDGVKVKILNNVEK